MWLYNCSLFLLPLKRTQLCREQESVVWRGGSCSVKRRTLYGKEEEVVAAYLGSLCCRFSLKWEIFKMKPWGHIYDIRGIFSANIFWLVDITFKGEHSRSFSFAAREHLIGHWIVQHWIGKDWIGTNWIGNDWIGKDFWNGLKKDIMKRILQVIHCSMPHPTSRFTNPLPPSAWESCWK